MIELSCVSGVGQPAAYALIILSESIRKQGLDVATKERVEKELATWLTEVNKGLSGYEQLQMFVIVNDPWTIENGLLTPTMKLKRAKIEASVADKLEGWYAHKKPVLWA